MKRNLVRRVATVSALVALAIGVLCLSGRGAQAESTIAALGELAPSTIGVALAFSTLAALLSGVEWWRLTRRLGYQTSYRSALAAYLSAGLAGYLANAVGPALGCAASLRRHGVSPARAALLTVLANALGFCGVLVWAPMGLLLLAHTGMDSTLPILGRQGPAAATLVVVALVVAMLLVLRALASAITSESRLARRLLGRLPATGNDRPLVLHTRQLLALVPWSAASWLAGICALYVVLASISPGMDLSLGAIVGSAALAATLGSLAVFVPEGMGVSDGVLIALLVHTTGLPATTCLTAALAMRTLDPLTKLGILGALALTANSVVARLLGGLRLWPSRRRACLQPNQ